MSETWETDNRWRRLKVSSELLSDIFACGVAGGVTTDAPNDLRVVGLNEVHTGPAGWYTFIVWSETFEPLPVNDNGRLLDEIPLVDFVYTRHYDTIPITEHLPDLTVHRGRGMQSETVLAYDAGEYAGWCAAVYVVQDDKAFWEYSTEGVSGYEWEVERIENVTHWMPMPSAPEE